MSNVEERGSQSQFKIRRGLLLMGAVVLFGLAIYSFFKPVIYVYLGEDGTQVVILAERAVESVGSGIPSLNWTRVGSILDDLADPDELSGSSGFFIKGKAVAMMLIGRKSLRYLKENHVTPSKGGMVINFSGVVENNILDAQGIRQLHNRMRAKVNWAKWETIGFALSAIACLLGLFLKRRIYSNT